MVWVDTIQMGDETYHIWDNARFHKLGESTRHSKYAEQPQLSCDTHGFLLGEKFN